MFANCKVIFENQRNARGCQPLSPLFFFQTTENTSCVTVYRYQRAAPSSPGRSSQSTPIARRLGSRRCVSQGARLTTNPDARDRALSSAARKSSRARAFDRASRFSCGTAVARNARGQADTPTASARANARGVLLVQSLVYRS